MNHANDNPKPLDFSAPGYETLARVLADAFDQAAHGKGKERHANARPFDQQPMQDLIRLHGVGFATGQASKKASEALGLPTHERRRAELLGAIVYLAGAIVALDRVAAAGPAASPAPVPLPKIQAPFVTGSPR